MTIKEKTNELFFDENGKRIYDCYITLMIDNPDFFFNFLVPQINNEITKRSLSLADYSLSLLKHKYKQEKDAFENKQTPFQNQYNLQIPECVELIDDFYNKQFISYQEIIDSFDYENEKSQFINYFINIEKEIYNCGGHIKFLNHKEYTIDDICKFVSENADDLYKCYLYLINNN